MTYKRFLGELGNLVKSGWEVYLTKSLDIYIRRKGVQALDPLGAVCCELFLRVDLNWKNFVYLDNSEETGELLGLSKTKTRLIDQACFDPVALREKPSVQRTRSEIEHVLGIKKVTKRERKKK